MAYISTIRRPTERHTAPVAALHPRLNLDMVESQSRGAFVSFESSGCSHCVPDATLYAALRTTILSSIIYSRLASSVGERSRCHHVRSTFHLYWPLCASLSLVSFSSKRGLPTLSCIFFCFPASNLRFSPYQPTSPLRPAVLVLPLFRLFLAYACCDFSLFDLLSYL